MQTRLPVDAVDSRFILGAYASIAIALGLFTALWGPIWVSGNGSLNGLPFGIHALVRTAGVAIVLVGCCAAGLAGVAVPRDRRRALGWFTLGHAVILGMLILQRIAIWPSGLADWVIGACAAATGGLFYAWSTAYGDPVWWRPQMTTLFGQRAGKDDPADVRSRYEQQIRLAAAQEERNRLARELHDSIKQQVFAIQAAAATAETRLGTDRDGARDALSMVRASSREAMAELEAVTDQLRAAPLENAGLVEALRKQAEALGFRTGAHVDVTIGRLPPNASLSPGTQQAIFRVAQEALANVARHARAARVKVSLEFTAGELVLRVVDDGVGFDASRGVGGSGIDNMRSRAAELGGSVDITAAASGGTSVRLTVPVTFNSPKVYLRKAFISAAVLAFVGIVVPLTSHEQDSLGWLHWSVLTILSLESIRYARAWIRARRLAVNSA